MYCVSFHLFHAFLCIQLYTTFCLHCFFFLCGIFFKLFSFFAMHVKSENFSPLKYTFFRVVWILLFCPKKQSAAIIPIFFYCFFFPSLFSPPNFEVLCLIELLFVAFQMIDGQKHVSIQISKAKIQSVSTILVYKRSLTWKIARNHFPSFTHNFWKFSFLFFQLQRFVFDLDFWHQHQKSAPKKWAVSLRIRFTPSFQ